MAYDSWYCGLPSFFSDRIESCIPTAGDQAAIMRGNFGKASNPYMVDASVSDYQSWLDTIGYDKQVSDLVQQGKNTSYINFAILGGIAFIALTMIVSPHGPRRYGR